MDHQDKQARRALYEALLSLRNEEEMERFLADLCTPKELDSFVERLQIARLLMQGDMGYREIAAETGASTTTVSRVARFLKQEPYQGYKIVLDRTGSAGKK